MAFYEVQFNDANLHEYCSILNIKREVLPVRENFSRSIPNMNGSHYTGFKFGEKTIQLEIGIVSTDRVDYMQKVKQIAKILAVNTPSKLILSDEPDIYYYAVPTDTTELEKNFNTGTCTILLKCYDPIGYSSIWRTYETIHPNGIIELNNRGTTDTYPLIDVDFTSKACFYQVTNPQGKTILIGTPSNMVEDTVEEKTDVIEDDCSDSTTFSPLAQSLLDDKRKADGNFGVGNNGDRIVCTNFGNEAEKYWNGTAFKRNLNDDIKDFEVSVDLSFCSYDYPYLGNGGSTGGSLGVYRVVNCSGLHINKTAKVGNPIHTMPAGTFVYPKEIKNGWAKHTTNGYTGYSSMTYLEKYKTDSSKSVARSTEEDDTDQAKYVENEMGLLEIYGYDKYGVQLFKFQFTDKTKFFEYVEPQLYIGGNLVLDDNKNCPAPKTTYVSNGYGDDNKKEFTETKVVSGVFGDYNDFEGVIKIKRETNSKGNQLWSASISKIYNGKTISSMSITNKASGSKYPTGDLSYLGFYIGKYGNNPEVNTMSINNVKVKKLNFKADQIPTENLQIFKAGDHLQIDTSKGEVLLNGERFMEKLDIGSNFFTVPVGDSEIRCISDGTQLSICGIQDRFL